MSGAVLSDAVLGQGSPLAGRLVRIEIGGRAGFGVGGGAGFAVGGVLGAGLGPATAGGGVGVVPGVVLTPAGAEPGWAVFGLLVVHGLLATPPSVPATAPGWRHRHLGDVSFRRS